MELAHDRALIWAFFATSFITLIEEKMHDALLYNWWLDTDNFIKNTRPVFSKALPLVLRYVLPSQLVQKAQARLAGYKMVEVDDEQKGGALKQKIPQVYLQARNIYAQLARKLGTKEYFFGEK